MVAVYHIDTMGGRIESLNSLTKDIWLSVCHLPGKVNIEADRLSRSTHIDLEWFGMKLIHYMDHMTLIYLHQ